MPPKRKKNPDPGPTPSSSTSDGSSSPDSEQGAKKAKKTPKLGKSLVHDEFEQTMTEDSNGRKKWTSKCKICQEELKDKQ